MRPVTDNDDKPNTQKRITMEDLRNEQVEPEADKLTRKVSIDSRTKKPEKYNSIKARFKKNDIFSELGVFLKKIVHKPKKVVIIAAVVLVGVGALLYRFTAPVHITKIETLQAISSRVDDPPVKSEFSLTDPIMLYFEFEAAKVNSAVNYEVVDQYDNVVKNGSTTVLRQVDNSEASGKRYVSIVNTSSTSLVAGAYRIILTMDNREVGAISFIVTE